ncbi:hypothetical protein AAHA92_28854 [Salvia divinorum]|uniref:Uncharacterized protein n=1 Tax=Salvia divinorum TaxID=28513 RepID=A0ABD1FWD3_SALDI
MVFSILGLLILCLSVYPKVKVLQEIEETDHYDYGITSLRSLKAFEWLSRDHYSSDDSPVSVVRIPGSDFPKSPTPALQASKETNKPPIGGSNKNKRPTSAPRRLCCAALSSPGVQNAFARSNYALKLINCSCILSSCLCCSITIKNCSFIFLFQ